MLTGLLEGPRQGTLKCVHTMSVLIIFRAKSRFLSAFFMPGLGAKAIVGSKARLLPKLSSWEGGKPYCSYVEAEHRARSVVLEAPQG